MNPTQNFVFFIKDSLTGEETRESGIVVAKEMVVETAQDRGVIVACGPECSEEVKKAMEDKATVFFGPYSAAEAKIDEVDYLIVREDDLTAIMQ